MFKTTDKTTISRESDPSNRFEPRPSLQFMGSYPLSRSVKQIYKSNESVQSICLLYDIYWR